ncbi:MAG: GGDEF domain-containing protein [Acidobacteria bacterium]|nr:GGDEF domain-containing protein [Acidobacteriota bacterium]
MPLIHRIEDLQFVCFALIFGVMAFQSRRNATIRYVWCSYLLAVAVAVVDFSVAQPLSLFANCLILTILSLRYAVLAAGMASFTGKARRLAMVCFGAVAVACCMLGLGKAGISAAVVRALYYILLTVQLLLICTILVRSRERSTRVPRWLLAALFLLSAAYRVNQMAFALSDKGPFNIWLRDQGLFLNSTILGCLLPFTIVWMMNARDHTILLKQSLVDPLTNLLNRRGLADAANRELARYARQRKDFAVAVGDIDHFKALNDTYGHSFGDEVLVTTAKLLRDQLRQTDIVARTGGEEFLLLLPHTREDEMVPVLERLRVLLEQQTMKTESGSEAGITLSIGVTNTCGRTGLSWTELQKEADAALYQAKEQGRNRIVRAASAS